MTVNEYRKKFREYCEYWGQYGEGHFTIARDGLQPGNTLDRHENTSRHPRGH